VLPFMVRFPKKVTATHTISVYYHRFDAPGAPGGLQAAIIKQATTRSPADITSARSDVTLYTNIEYPFTLTEPVFTYVSRHDFTTDPAAVSPTLSFTNERCRDVATEPCEQEWAIVLHADLSPPVCDFTGDWNLTFTVLCEPSLVSNNTCPLPFVPAHNRFEYSGVVQFHLTTENFCPTVLADVGLTASLVSFQDHPHAIVKNNFLSGATAYFVATAASPDVTIVETTLLTVRSDGTTLYDTAGAVHNAVFTAEEFPRALFGGVSPHPSQTYFSIVLDPLVFPVNVDASASFDIWATLNVVFANTGQEGGMHTRQFTVLMQRVFAAADAGANPVDARAAVGLAAGSLHGSGVAAISFSGLVLAALALLQLAL